MNNNIVAVLTEKVRNLEERAKDFVTRTELLSEIGPLKAVYYGLISLILLTVLGALLKLVLKV